MADAVDEVAVGEPCGDVLPSPRSNPFERGGDDLASSHQMTVWKQLSTYASVGSAVLVT